MATRDRSQGFAFVLPHTVVNFNKDVKVERVQDTQGLSDYADVYDILAHAMDLLDTSDYSDNEIIDALLVDLEKFRKGGK